MTNRPTVLAARIAAGALMLAVVSACSFPQTFVDGYPIGERVEADDQFTDFAIAVLDDQRPGHVEVASTELYTPDIRSADGQRVLYQRSGGHDRIVVLRLTDGSVRAFYVGCGVGAQPDRCFWRPPDDVMPPE